MLAALVAVLSGCARFERQWREAAPADARRDPFLGRWEGQWRSDKNQHHGALRCIITHSTNDLYTAQFHARYRRVVGLTFGYTARMQARREGDRMTFHGEADLGWYAGGVYRYQGFATTTNFQSSYSSRYDFGAFEMFRPAPAASGR